jgi:hydrogenase maturation factor HypE
MESPKHHRVAAYAAIKKYSGNEELEEIKKAVKQEYMRKMERINNFKTKKPQNCD